MKSDKSASVFALAVIVGIILYALTEKPWMFFLGFLGCFLPVFFGIPDKNKKRKRKAMPKPYVVGTGSFVRSVAESYVHEDR